MKDTTCGVVLCRMQPLHKAHMWLIESALAENDKVCIVLGSSNKEGMKRNPFSLQLRMDMLKGSLMNIKDIFRIQVFELADWSQESNIADNKIWGHYLYYNIVAHIEQKKFRLYYSDEPSIVENWIDDEIREYFGFRFFERSNVYDGLSATKIRKAILSFGENPESEEYLRQYLTPSVYNMVPYLKELLTAVEENPKEDFSMKIGG